MPEKVTPDYQKMYLTLFNAVTDALRLQEKSVILLKAAQIQCEEMYIQENETPIQE